MAETPENQHFPQVMILPWILRENDTIHVRGEFLPERKLLQLNLIKVKFDNYDGPCPIAVKPKLGHVLPYQFEMKFVEESMVINVTKPKNSPEVAYRADKKFTEFLTLDEYEFDMKLKYREGNIETYFSDVFIAKVPMEAEVIDTIYHLSLFGNVVLKKFSVKIEEPAPKPEDKA